MGWNANATAFRGRNGARFVYTCPKYGAASNVWGTDVYTDDSSVCTAAVHAGRITLAGGGSVTIEMRPGQDSYAGSTRNGITSSAYPKFGGSFVIVGAGPPTGSATGRVLVNGVPFTSGTISYGSTINVTAGTLTLSTDVGTLLLSGDGKSLANAVMTRTFERVKSKKQPIVQLALAGGDFTVCGARKTSARAPGIDNKTPKPKTTVRALWGKGNGHFRTKGRYSSAAVRGTNWLTADRCDGTLTQVKQGIVSVTDFTRKKTVKVRAGQSYLAPARR